MANEISFQYKVFQYVIQFADDELYIECSHCEEYYTWSKRISTPISSDTSDNTKSTLNMRITPSLLFKLLLEYKNNTINAIYTFKFPEGYKTPETSLYFELVTKLPHSEEADIKLILLEPREIPDSLRFDSKLTHVRNNMDRKHQEDMDFLKRDINGLEGRSHEHNTKIIDLENKNKELEGKIKNLIAELAAYPQKFVSKEDYNDHDYACSDDLNALDKKFITKAEFNTILMTYVTKTELNAHEQKCAAKTDLTNLATRGEVAALDNKFVPK